MKYVTEARLHAIITGTRAGTWEWRVDGDELLVNDRWAEMLGYQHDELAPYSLHTWTQLAHPSDRDRFEDQLKGFRTSSPPPFVDSIIRLRHKDGSWRWVHSRGMSIKEADGSVWLVGTHIDVTGEHKARHQLEQLAASLPGVIYTFCMNTDGSAHFKYISRRIQEFFGLSVNDLISDWERYFTTILPEDMPHVLSAIEESSRTLCDLNCEYRIKINGTLHWLQSIASTERDDNGQITWHGMLLNIDEHKRLEQELERLTITDELTGLSNRRHLIYKLEELSAMSERYRLGYSIVSIDIDYFKRINDTYGHLVGDRVLRTFAEIIQNRLRHTDVAARMGGEEFMLLLSNTEADAARVIAEQLRQALADTVFHSDQGEPFRVTLSAGVAAWHPPSARTRELLARCDQALYAAKRRGRNQVVVLLDEDDETTPEQA